MPYDKQPGNSARLNNSTARKVVIVAFDGVQILDVTGPAAVFGKAEQLRPGSYRISIASLAGGDVVSESGVTLAQTIALADIPFGVDTVLIAGSDRHNLEKAVYGGGLSDWTKRIARTTRRMGSVCTGAFVLAKAGLLDGRRATTHWHSCELLQDLCPAAMVEFDTIYTVDPPIYTSAGVTAGIDLALALLEEDHGRSLTNEVARELVIFVRRPGSAGQLSIGLAAQANASDRIRDLVTWIVDNPGADLSVSVLAERVGMSERNFGRTFRKEAGETPARFVEFVRLEHACDLLQRTDWTLDKVAQRSGFRSTDAFRGAFLRKFEISPSAYRRQLNRDVGTSNESE